VQLTTRACLARGRRSVLDRPRSPSCPPSSSLRGGKGPILCQVPPNMELICSSIQSLRRSALEVTSLSASRTGAENGCSVVSRSGCRLTSLGIVHGGCMVAVDMGGTPVMIRTAVRLLGFRRSRVSVWFERLMAERVGERTSRFGASLVGRSVSTGATKSLSWRRWIS
jgi:hypothetical protein